MLKRHEKFYSAAGKRKVMVVDDEMINRHMLGAILEDQYDVIYAVDGKDAYEQIMCHKETLSVILLDLMMPVLSGIDLLKKLNEDDELADIPVIVMTSDQNAEVECLNLGASDFIPKPYPKHDVVHARIQRTIELSEDRQIINTTERDPLTGLYTREYFYNYAEQYDNHHKGIKMDAILIDINHFHMINERFGTNYGDGLLRIVGERLCESVGASGGIVCRREADTFLIYCPHGNDYEEILDNASIEIAADNSVNNRIRIRMGIYADVDKSLDMQRRFDRAKLAADTLRKGFTRSIAFYDKMLHEQELFDEELIEGFQRAIDEKQFEVYYQPKFDIRNEFPVISSAEALVRWTHPKLGRISPGVFIPLFEENGLIQKLDRYVWETVVRQQRQWKETLGIPVPVSVNVSRVDMYDPRLVTVLEEILQENGIGKDEFFLEITESAYMRDSEQIIETAVRLRELDFRIEMDDFGSGYSSLNAVSTLPIDALKLDMHLVRNAFNQSKDARLLEIIIDIADYLCVPVIAEGVETKEQFLALKEAGCDLVQGYYFSKPMSAYEYEQFIIAQGQTAENANNEAVTEEQNPEEKENAEDERPEESSEVGFSSIAKALARDYFSIYYVDLKTERFVEYSAYDDYESLGIEKEGEDFFNVSRRNMKRVGHPDDLPMFMETFTKGNVEHEIERNGAFTITYRLMIKDIPTYVHMKASAMEDDIRHIVIGVSNIDSQMRRELEQAAALRAARERVSKDPMTGVKSKYAYDEAKSILNERIAAGGTEPFALAICDVNGLKEINDTKGHSAGDKLIIDACRIICDNFKHSPVFRIGGDEFAVILSGRDHVNRVSLGDKFFDGNIKRMSRDGIVIACGISDFDSEDTDMEDVFQRADNLMYENKKLLKKIAAGN